MMQITLEQTDDELVVLPKGRIDTSTAEEFGDKLMAAIEEADCVRIDFEEVAYISSAGLRALLNAQKIVNRNGKELICCNINEIVESVLVSTGFTNILTIE